VLDQPAYHQPHAPVTAFAEMIHREMTVNDTATPLAVEALMLELVTSAIRSHPQRERRVPGWLVRARERIHSEFRSSISLQSLSVEAGVHPVHLSRTFRRHFGCSIAEYQRRLRLEWARGRLMVGDEPVGRIAVEAGFADHSEFTRRFVDATGVTPSRFRTRQ
jgi:AraC family transcriptional regulator